MIMGTKSLSKRKFLRFAFFVNKIEKTNLFDENKPPEALLPPSGGCWEIQKQDSKIQRSPERLLDEKERLEDQLSHPELKFGGRKFSF